MYIKNIFNVKNYKGLENNFKVEFDDVTYIVGDNAKCKSTVGYIPLWILTGYNALGSNKEKVSNDANINENTTASMTIIDNEGNTHVITRSKGKEDFVMIDGIRTTKDILSKFYKDIHAFICAYNPNYFRSLELAKQRELLLRILPAVSKEQAFNLLRDDEKEILEEPIVDIKGFCKAKRKEIKDLTSELDIISGKKETLLDIVLEKEESEKAFVKENELKNLKEDYEKLVLKSSEILKIEDLERDIKKIEDKINRNIKEDLKLLQEKYKKEQENLLNVDSNTSTCPVCKQEIKNESLIRVLKNTYKNNIEGIKNKIENLKQETKELLSKKQIQEEKYNIAKTPEMLKLSKLKENYKQKIENLEKEKNEINLFNKEVFVKHNAIVNAKENILELDNRVKQINELIDKYTKQLKIATRLNFLIIEEQMKSVKSYLNKVSIEFSKIDEDTGEILDVYNIKYDGRDYEKLSRSYKLKADIEIATLINKIMDINTPIFIDDAESITNIDTNLNSQIIISFVIKYNDLEILYSYPEVLKRERDSINKKIDVSDRENYIVNAA